MEEFEKIASEDEKRVGKILLFWFTLIFFLLALGINATFSYADFVNGGFQALLGTPLIVFCVTMGAFIIIILFNGKSKGNTVDGMKLTVSDSDIVLDYGMRKFSVRLDKVTKVNSITNREGRVIRITLFQFKHRLDIGGFHEMEEVKSSILKRLEGRKVKIKESVDKEIPLLKLLYLLIPLALLIYSQIFTGTVVPLVFIIIPVMLLITLVVVAKHLTKIRV